jgi:hypothetical protein
MDSQLPSLHLRFALSQPINDKATLLLYLYDEKHECGYFSNFEKIQTLGI